MARRQRPAKVSQSISHRLIAVLEELGLSMSAASRAMNYQTSATLHAIRAGKTLPDVARLSELAAQYSVNLHWLITGEGDRFVIPENLKNQAKSKMDVDIINNTLRLSDASKQALLVLLTER
jgi:transcriptional regulator with XRE-family HTH domain